MPNLNKLFPVVFFGLFSVLTAQITSAGDGNWDVPSTWIGGVLPDSTDNVLIDTPHTVTIPNYGNAYMLDLTIDGTLIGNFRATLEVKGDWNNNGIFTAGNLCKVIFKGETDQNVDPGGHGFDYIEIINTGAPANTIAISDDLDISQDLTFRQGTLDLTDGGNPTVDIGGNITILNGAVWTKGNGTVTFDGSSQTFDDQNGSPNNIGNIVVE